MHPSLEKLKLYIENKLDAISAADIGGHIETCEFCQEFCDDYRLFLNSLNAARSESLPQKARAIADRLFDSARNAFIIPLKIMTTEPAVACNDILLAADGEEKGLAAVTNLATLYSEDPEIVLRLMRDMEQGNDYLQLISDETNLISQVLVSIPELGREYLTDNTGRADLDKSDIIDYKSLKWQVKLPKAQFDFRPLDYDPEKVEYQNQYILETEHNDKIKIEFVGKSMGKQIAVSILQIDGSTDYGPVKIVISQHNESHAYEAAPKKSLIFHISDSADAINIRLFD